MSVPEPPQQTVPYHPPVKGSLPVPRNVLAGAGSKDKASDEWLNDAAKRPQRPIKHTPGSREEWKVKMTESRRRNLREGVKSLKARQQYEQRKEDARARQANEARQIALNAPEREDERLTTPTHGLDLSTLLHAAPSDPHRDSRLEHKRANVAHHVSLRSEARLNHLHTLYMNARTFIVTPQQLDTAVDEAFGTPEQPVSFAYEHSSMEAAQSVWGLGKPASVQDLLVQSQGGGQGAVRVKGGLEASRERLRRIAEELTGGAMEEEG